MTLQLQATPKEIMRAVQALQDFGREKQVGDRDLFALALALEECGSNIVDHTFRRDPRQTLTVRIDCAPDAVTIELRDSGPQFDPSKYVASRSAETQNHDSHRGRGLRLVRRYIDEILYRREGGENVLRLTKRLSPAGSTTTPLTPSKNQ